MVVHLWGPCCSTSWRTRQSSSSVHGPFIRVTLWFFPEVFYKFLIRNLVLYLQRSFQLWVLGIIWAWVFTFITFFRFSEHSVDIFQLLILYFVWNCCLSPGLRSFLHTWEQWEGARVAIIYFGSLYLRVVCQSKISLIVVPWVYASVGSSADYSLRSYWVDRIWLAIWLTGSISDFSFLCLSRVQFSFRCNKSEVTLLKLGGCLGQTWLCSGLRNKNFLRSSPATALYRGF